MDYKFSNMDISKFDPTNASVHSVRKWLFAIIDAELDKEPEERDYDLIEECSECERELPTGDAGMSEKELSIGLERIKAQVSEIEGKESKIIISKKKSKKSVRVIVILAAAISTFLLSVSAIAISQGKSVGEFISENIQKIFNMDAGDKLENGEITLIKNGEMTSYFSVREAVEAVGEDILYPDYLPEGIAIERVVVVSGEEGKIKNIIFISSDEQLNINVSIQKNYISDDEINTEVYKTSFADYYIFEKDGEVQATGLYGDNKYSIKYSDYDEILKILDGLKEIEK